MLFDFSSTPEALAAEAFIEAHSLTLTDLEMIHKLVPTEECLVASALGTLSLACTVALGSKVLLKVFFVLEWLTAMRTTAEHFRQVFVFFMSLALCFISKQLATVRMRAHQGDWSIEWIRRASGKGQRPRRWGTDGRYVRGRRGNRS